MGRGPRRWTRADPWSPGSRRILIQGKWSVGGRRNRDNCQETPPKDMITDVVELVRGFAGGMTPLLGDILRIGAAAGTAAAPRGDVCIVHGEGVGALKNPVV